jgi:hypothetical protein
VFGRSRAEGDARAQGPETAKQVGSWRDARWVGEGGIPRLHGLVAQARLRPILAEEVELRPRREDDGALQASTERLDLLRCPLAQVDGRAREGAGRRRGPRLGVSGDIKCSKMIALSMQWCWLLQNFARIHLPSISYFQKYFELPYNAKTVPKSSLNIFEMIPKINLMKMKNNRK